MQRILGRAGAEPALRLIEDGNADAQRAEIDAGDDAHGLGLMRRVMHGLHGRLARDGTFQPR